MIIGTFVPIIIRLIKYNRFLFSYVSDIYFVVYFICIINKLQEERRPCPTDAAVDSSGDVLPTQTAGVALSVAIKTCECQVRCRDLYYFLFYANNKATVADGISQLWSLVL